MGLKPATGIARGVGRGAMSKEDLSSGLAMEMAQ